MLLDAALCIFERCPGCQCGLSAGKEYSMKFSALAIVVFGVAAASAPAEILHVPMYPFFGSATNERFGFSIASGADISGDGINDLLVGAPNYDGSAGVDCGAVFVVSGRTGLVLFRVEGSAPGEQFGYSVGIVGEVVGGGRAAYVVGTPYSDVGATNAGRASVYWMTAHLVTAYGAAAEARLGESVAGAGDVNNDGWPDFVVGAYGEGGTGRVKVYSGNSSIGQLGSLLYTFSGDGGGDQMGRVVAGAGDVNNDGFNDIVASAPYDDNAGTNSGSVRVFSGATGLPLFTFDGDRSSFFYGIAACCGAGDVNGDGYDDILVGAYNDDGNGAYSGSVRVYSGATGALLRMVNGDDAGDRFGSSVCGAGDLNSDGFDDFLVGAYTDATNGAASGSVYAVSGATGARLGAWHGEVPGGNFGAAVAGAGLMNGDAIPDFIVSTAVDSRGGAAAGMAQIFLSKISSCPSPCYGDSNGSQTVNFADITTSLAHFGEACAPGGATNAVHVSMLPFLGNAENARLGGDVAKAGDVNNDGVDDVILGAILEASGSSAPGAARVISGATGQVLHLFTGEHSGSAFGFAVDGAGDVNHDGYDDVIVGAPLWTPSGSGTSYEGKARVFSGATGAVLYEYTGGLEYRTGIDVCGAGDVNNDGFADFMVAASTASTNGIDSGQVIVYSGATGTALYTFNGSGANSHLALAKAAWDVNNDGFDDLLLGEAGDEFSVAARVEVRSGADGSLLYAPSLFAPLNAFAASGTGDVNNDGHADFIIGTGLTDEVANDSGSARVYSGADGTVMYALYGTSAGDRFGSSVAGAGDVNADGFADVIVAAIADDTAVGVDSGSVGIYSGIDGSFLFGFNGDAAGDRLGYSVGSAGDVNVDGRADVLAGSPGNDVNGTNAGIVRLFVSRSFSCNAHCVGDADGNLIVTFGDITTILAAFNAVCP